MSFLGHSQLYTQPSDFYKAIYAIRGNGSTRGMACAVINGRQVPGQESQDNTRGSVCLVTSSGCIEEYESQSFKVDRYSKKKMGRYQLEILNIIQTENFSFLLVNGNDSSKRLNVKYLTDEEQKRNFIVYTISASERLDRLILKYNQVTENYNLIVPENRFDFFLRGSPIIVDETYFVGVLKESDPGQFKPCFATEEEFVDFLPYHAGNSEPVEGNRRNSEHASEPGPESENVTEPDEPGPEPEAREQEGEPRPGLDLVASFRTCGGRVFSYSLRLTERCVYVGAAVLMGLAMIFYQCLSLVIDAIMAPRLRRAGIDYEYTQTRVNRSEMNEEESAMATSDYKYDEYDVLICCSFRDIDFVEQVLFHWLSENGFSFCVEFPDFTPRKPGKIVQAIRDSRTTIVVLSPDFVYSEFCSFELEMTLLNKAPLHRVVPILYRKCEIPQFLQDRNYLDLKSFYKRRDFEDALKTVLGLPAHQQLED